MRRIGSLGLVLLSTLLLGMGGSGGMPSTDTIPRPKERHIAELTDRLGVTTRVSYVSCEGKTFFPLKRGEGILMVPFSKLVRVRFGAEKEADVEATFQVEGGQSLEGRIPKTVSISGTTEFGNYRVEARGLREMAFLKP